MRQKRIITCMLAVFMLWSFTGNAIGSFLDWKGQSKNASLQAVKIPELKINKQMPELVVLPIILSSMPVFEEADRPLDNDIENGEGGDEGIPSAELYEVWNNLEVNPYRLQPDSVIVENEKIDFTGFTYPLVKNYRVTSEFGPRRYRYHYGIDLKVEIGDTVVSAFDGMVRIAKKMKGYGNFVLVRHHNGMETFYGHLDEILVKPDQVVKSGEIIGLGGNTGRSTGPHLHFELRYLGLPVNPRDMIDFQSLTAKSDTVMLTRNHFNYPKKSTKKGKVAVSKKSTASAKKPATKVASKATTAPAKAKAGASGTRVYVVKNGDSLGRIAQKTGVSVSKLCSLNGIGSNKVIKPGQKLKY